MDLVEIRCIVRGILATASLEDDQEERDIKCLKAIMKDPISSLICITTDAEILISEMVETCYQSGIDRLLIAAEQVFPRAGLYFQYQRQMHELFYEVALKRLQQIAPPQFDDLKTACTIFRKINEDKRGSAKSLVRRFAKEVGACRVVDEFIDSLGDAPETRDTIASALLESKGAYEIWMHIRPAYREGYKGFDAWHEAGKIKSQINMLMLMADPSPEIVTTIIRLVANLDLTYMDPIGGQKWVKQDTFRATWWKKHFTTTQ